MRPPVRSMLALGLIAAVWSTGCGGNDSTPPPVDAGPDMKDAGDDRGVVPVEDTGSAPADTGADAGGPPDDTGPTPTDAGPEDSGVVANDTGPDDAGHDAGGGDAGAVDVGCGELCPPDAGPPDVGPADAGPPDVGPSVPRRGGVALEVTAGGGNTSSPGYRLSASVQFGVASGAVGRAGQRQLLTGTVSRP